MKQAHTHTTWRTIFTKTNTPLKIHIEPENDGLGSDDFRLPGGV